MNPATTPEETVRVVSGALAASSIETGKGDGRSLDEEHKKTKKPVSGKTSSADGAGDFDRVDRDDDA